MLNVQRIEIEAVDGTYVELLSGESTRANTSRVGLDDGDHFVDVASRQTEATANAADRASRRGHEWIGAEVDVKHGGVGTFDDDFLGRVSHDIVQDEGRVLDTRLEDLSDLLVALQLGLYVDIT